MCASKFLNGGIELKHSAFPIPVLEELLCTPFSSPEEGVDTFALCCYLLYLFRKVVVEHGSVGFDMNHSSSFR